MSSLKSRFGLLLSIAVGQTKVELDLGVDIEQNLKQVETEVIGHQMSV